MSHQRTVIRNALVSLLTGTSPTWATNAQDRVYENRPYDVQNSKLPSIEIKDGSETAIPRDLQNRLYIRTWNVKIEIRIETGSNWSQALDDIAKQIEDLISANRSISGTATTVIYNGADEPENQSGEKVVATTALNYQIQYIY